MGRMGEMGSLGRSQAQISTKSWHGTTACVGRNFLIGDDTLATPPAGLGAIECTPRAIRMRPANWARRIATAVLFAWTIATGPSCARSQQVLTRIRLDAPVATAAISPTGRLVAAVVGRSVQKSDGSWTNSEDLEVFDPSAAKIIAKVEIPISGWTDSPPSFNGFVGYCDSGRYLAAYDGLGTVYVVDPESYRVERTVGLEKLPTRGALGMRRVACSSQASILLVSDAGSDYGWGHLAVYDIASGKLLSEARQNAQSGVEFGPVSISPNGSKAAVLLQNPRWKLIEGPDVEIRNTRDLKVAGYISTGDLASDIAFAGNLQIVTSHGDGDPRPSKNFLRLWNAETGKELRRFSDPQFVTEGAINASADGRKLIAGIVKYRVCHLCDGLEGRIDVKEQRFSVWETGTGAQLFRSEPLRPIIEPVGALCILSQDGNAVLIEWPHSEITPRVIHIPDH